MDVGILLIKFLPVKRSKLNDAPISKQVKKANMNQAFKITMYFILTLSLTLSSCKGQSQSSPSKNNKVNTDQQKIDKYLQNIQEENGIPGIALAIIKEGKLIYKQNNGYANIEHSVPISNNSTFRLYSLTKPFIAVGIFQLIEQGNIKLEDKISTYVSGLPSNWEKIQIKHLLTHSSGLPDMAGNHPYDVRELTEEEAKERVFALPIRFRAGERFEYNQTNFWLLKEIIEKVSRLNLSEFILKNQFPDAIKEHVFFSADSRDIIQNRVTPYFPFAKGILIADLPYTNGDYLFAAHSLHTTLDEFIKWDKRLSGNEFISKASMKKMWELFPYTNAQDEFAYSWGVSYLNGKRGYGFSGSMSTIYRIFPEDKLSIIFLTNGFTERYNMGEIINELAKLTIK